MCEHAAGVHKVSWSLCAVSIVPDSDPSHVLCTHITRRRGTRLASVIKLSYALSSAHLVQTQAVQLGDRFESCWLCRWRDLLSVSGGLAVRVISRQQLDRLAVSKLPVAELEIQSNERREFVGTS